MKKTEIKVEDTNKPIKSLTIRGQKVKLLNLKTQWTLEQENYASVIVKEIYKRMANVENSFAMTDIDVNNLTPEHIKVGFDLAVDFIDFNKDAELLALLYINDNEIEFNDETYQKRINLFLKSNPETFKKGRLAYQDFFDSVGKSIMEDSQTCLRAIQ